MFRLLNSQQQQQQQQQQRGSLCLDCSDQKTLAAAVSVPKHLCAAGERVFDFSRYSQRYVALHLMYIGWSYQGLARQADSENTIEVRKPSNINSSSVRHINCCVHCAAHSAQQLTMPLERRSRQLQLQQVTYWLL
jgi:hypothetical protein